MQPPLAAVEATESVDEVFAALSGGSPAVVVAMDGRPTGMLTRSDLLEYLAHARDSNDRLEELLRRPFPGDEVAVEDRTGGGDHFQVTVASERFDGLSLVEQHRLVYDALADPARGWHHSRAEDQDERNRRDRASGRRSSRSSRARTSPCS